MAESASVLAGGSKGKCAISKIVSMQLLRRISYDFMKTCQTAGSCLCESLQGVLPTNAMSLDLLILTTWHDLPYGKASF